MLDKRSRPSRPVGNCSTVHLHKTRDPSDGWGRESTARSIAHRAGITVAPSRGIFGGGQSAGIGSITGAPVNWGTNAFQSRQQITFSSGKEMLIRIKSRAGVE
jgi:hypothetical protein